MIWRLRFCNKDGVEARVEIQRGTSTPIIDVEGTGNPFTLSYNNDKGNKSGMFLTSSADIEIYETADFNIDNLKTSNETELAITYYINDVVKWKGFIIPDFFSIEVKSNPVIVMTASDRIGTLKNVTLSDLPSMISLRELAVLCLNKTGLTIPLKTMADFNNGTGTNDFFNSKILTQRLSDTKGRSISCYDILSSILTASNSFLVQRSGGWHIINKIQHEAGSGKLYTGATSFINWSDVIFNFSDINVGGRRTIVPVASTVGVFHEFGGGRLNPVNHDFSQGLTGWEAKDGFVASIENRQVKGFVLSDGAYIPDYGDATNKNYLVNRNYVYMDVPGRDGQPRLSITDIPIITSNPKEVKVSFDINATGKNKTHFSVAVCLFTGTKRMFLNNDGIFQNTYTVIDVYFKDDSKDDLAAIMKGLLLSAVVKAEDGEDVSDYKLEIDIFGGGSKSSYAGGYIMFDTTVLVNSISLKCITSGGEIPKGNIYKSEQGQNFTKKHDINTTIFGDYLTSGLNGYFYDYPIDDTSSIYNTNDELTSKWTAPNDTEELPLLQHITRQKSRMFSVAHNLLSAEIEVNNFDPLAIFVACGKRYTVVSGSFDFFKSNVKAELEEIAYATNSKRDYIYSYFGDGEDNIKSIGGISAGVSGGGTGGGLTSEQLEILSWWKKDPDNENTIFTEMNAYSKLELSAYGLGSGGGGGGDGSLVIWGTEANGGVGLTVEGITKTLALKSGLDLKQDKLTAGTGITIIGNTISLAGGGGGSTVVWGALANGYRQLTVEGVTYGLAQNTHKHLWADITDKPSTFAPSAHTHAWADITSKPSTFAPSAHTHAAGDITSGTFAIARIPTGTTASTVALGNHLHTGVYEPVFSKNTAFNKNFGTDSGTVAQGNDSRIINGQTAYGWGNHASAGYALNSALTTHTENSTIHITATERTNWNAAYNNNHTHSNKSVLDGITAALVNNWGAAYTHSQISGESTVHHTHSNKTALNGITSTLVGNWNTAYSNNHTHSNKTVIDGITSAKVSNWDGAYTHSGISGESTIHHTHSNKANLNSINQNMSSSDTITFAATILTSYSRAPKFDLGNSWTIEASGSELVFKYNNVIKQRLLTDGSLAAVGEVTAYVAGTGTGYSDFLPLSGGTLTGNLNVNATLTATTMKVGSNDVLHKGNIGSAGITSIGLGNGWTIEQTATHFYIKKNGVVKGTFNA